MSDLELDERRARIEPLLEAARVLADANTERGARARSRIATASGLSVQNVDLALTHCLEHRPPEHELEALLRATPRARSAHVLLSANVFVGAFRAIAIGLAASDEVFVRPSRREPEMAELLREGAPRAFRIVNELSPRAGDRLWAYGSDQTLEEVATTLPPGVALHGHGAGFGVAVVSGKPSDAELESIVSGLALDVALFDQRGCLSPRVLVVESEHAAGLASELGAAIARTLCDFEERVPRGVLDHDELVAIGTYRDTALYVGELLTAGSGFVSIGRDPAWLLPPIGRNLHVLAGDDALAPLARVRPLITSAAFFGSSERKRALRAALPGARVGAFGRMQCPPLDGPVDLRNA